MSSKGRAPAPPKFCWLPLGRARENDAGRGGHAHRPPRPYRRPAQPYWACLHPPPARPPIDPPRASDAANVSPAAPGTHDAHVEQGQLTLAGEGRDHSANFSVSLRTDTWRRVVPAAAMMEVAKNRGLASTSVVLDHHMQQMRHAHSQNQSTAMPCSPVATFKPVAINTVT